MVNVSNAGPLRFVAFLSSAGIAYIVLCSLCSSDAAHTPSQGHHAKGEFRKGMSWKWAVEVLESLELCRG